MQQFQNLLYGITDIFFAFAEHLRFSMIVVNIIRLRMVTNFVWKYYTRGIYFYRSCILVAQNSADFDIKNTILRYWYHCQNRCAILCNDVFAPTIFYKIKKKKSIHLKHKEKIPKAQNNEGISYAVYIKRVALCRSQSLLCRLLSGTYIRYILSRSRNTTYSA